MAKRKRYKVDDLKRCGVCGAVFLQASCPFCGEGTWNYERGISDRDRLALYDQCVCCGKKGVRNALTYRLPT